MRELHEILLASASPRRRELLASLGLRVTVVPSDVDEGPRPGFGPRELARLHAGSKADVAAARDASRLIVAADTVVDVDGIALGKPRDDAEAGDMLRILSGRTHVVHTAYVLVDGPSGRRSARDLSTSVTFYQLSNEEIASYIATGEPLDKAGAYGIQGRGATLVERIDGDFYTVMGLPLASLVRTLREFGYVLPPPGGAA
jgi:septum formation protein